VGRPPTVEGCSEAEPNPSGGSGHALGSPLFDRATIHLDNGRTFTVESVRKSSADIYVQAVTLNGKALDRPWITHQEILDGGVLRFGLGPLPDKDWGISGVPSPD
jgi:putative alpha-1,2-mannosidase